MDGMWMRRVWCGKTPAACQGAVHLGLLEVLPPLPPPLVTGGWSQTLGVRGVCGKHRGRTQHQLGDLAVSLGLILWPSLINQLLLDTRL